MAVKATTVSDALDHMVVCGGELETWKFFKKNAKLLTSAPDKSVYSQLSDYLHTQIMSAKENVVSISEWIEPIAKRFLLHCEYRRYTRRNQRSGCYRTRLVTQKFPKKRRSGQRNGKAVKRMKKNNHKKLRRENIKMNKIKNAIISKNFLQQQN